MTTSQENQNDNYNPVELAYKMAEVLAGVSVARQLLAIDCLKLMVNANEVIVTETVQELVMKPMHDMMQKRLEDTIKQFSSPSSAGSIPPSGQGR